MLLAVLAVEPSGFPLEPQIAHQRKNDASDRKGPGRTKKIAQNLILTAQKPYDHVRCQM